MSTQETTTEPAAPKKKAKATKKTAKSKTATAQKKTARATKAKSAAYFADRSKAKLLTDPMTTESFNDATFWAIVPQMIMGLDLRAGLEKVQAPVLVIHGKQDPLESAQEVHETFPGSRLEILENAGHFPWLEQPDAFYEKLDAFLGMLYEHCP